MLWVQQQMVLFMGNIPYMDICFVCLLDGRHLGCCQVLILMNMTNINICVQFSVYIHIFISLGLIPRSGMPGSQHRCKFTTRGNS